MFFSRGERSMEMEQPAEEQPAPQLTQEFLLQQLTAITSRLGNLENAATTTDSRFATILQQLSSLQAPAVAPPTYGPAPAPPPSHHATTNTVSLLPPSVKVPALEPFTGGREDVKQWLTTARTFAAITGLNMSTPTAVAYIAGRLQAPEAVGWFQGLQASFHEHDPRYASAGFDNFEQFAAAMQLGCGEQFPEDKAREKLLDVRQDKDDVARYASRFQAIVRDLPKMHPDDVRFFFKRGLRPDLQVMITGKYPDTATWLEVRDIAHRHDSLRAVNPAATPVSAPAATPVPAASGVTDMEINSIRYRTSRTSGIASSSDSSRGRPSTPHPRNDNRSRESSVDSERGYMLKKGLCFYCKEPGHTRMQCPKRKADKN